MLANDSTSETGGTTEADLSRTILLTKAIRAAWAAIVMQSVIVPFFLFKGVDSAGVFLLQSSFALVNVVLQVPTGILADRFGKRSAIRAASFLRGVGATGLIFLGGFQGVLICYVFIMSANALFAGCDQAIIHQAHAAQSAPKKALETHFSEQHFLACFAAAGGALMGAAVSSYSFTALAIVNALVAWLPFALSFRLPPEPGSTQQIRNLVPPPVLRQRQVDDPRAGQKDARFNSRRIALFLMGIVFPFSMSSALYVFQFEWKRYGFALLSAGAVFATYNLVTGTLSFFLRKRVAALTPAQMAVSLGALGGLTGTLAAQGSPQLTLAAYVALVGLSHVIVNTKLNAEINRAIGNTHRVTILSCLTAGSALLLGGLGKAYGALQLMNNPVPYHVASAAAFLITGLLAGYALRTPGPDLSACAPTERS